MDTAIITAPRKVCYLSQSLESYYNVWGKDKPVHVFCEPGSQWFVGNTTTINHVHEKTLGISQNWLTALEYMYNHTEGPILMCEDDVLWFASIGDYPKDEVVSFWTNLYNVNTDVPCWGEAKYPITKWGSILGWCGSLALLIPRTVAYDILQLKNLWVDEACDYWFGQCMRILSRKIYVHNPTLVDHLGTEHSTHRVEKLDLWLRKPYYGDSSSTSDNP